MKGPAPIFIGFRVKQVPLADEWLRASGGYAKDVIEICSISDCVAKPPADWINRWDFNRKGCYDSESIALATIPADEADRYELFAYRVFPLEFDKVQMRVVDLHSKLPDGLPQLPPEPDLSSYQSIGYDLQSGYSLSNLGFSCSPLSCNGCAAEFPVNRYCLIDDLDEAVRVVTNFGKGEVASELGPFYLYEVLRKRSDKWQT